MSFFQKGNNTSKEKKKISKSLINAESIFDTDINKALKLVEEGKYSADELKAKHSLSQTQVDKLNKVITLKK